MTTAEQILVILLGVALAVLLVLAIAAVIFIIRLVQSLRRIAESAERVVHSAETIGDIFRKSATPLGVINFVKHLVDMVGKGKKGN
jgi:hypothetical protein